MWVEPVTLVGREIRLEPMAESHVTGLWEAAEDHLFRYMRAWWYSESEEAFRNCILKNIEDPAVVPLTVIQQSTGKPIGSSSFMDIRPEHRGLEIGATWIARSHQGTSVNPEMKYLMVRHAFETLGCIRVQLKTDGRNLQSQRAMEKLGCKKDGILRNHLILPDGHIRDSVYYSILPNEWPDVRTGLEARLGYSL